jgi:hypothetical protein
VAGIRNNGSAPCHRCLVAKGALHKLGAPTDTERETSRSEAEGKKAVEDSRQEIFEGGYAVASTKVEEFLKPQSLVPTIVRPLSGLASQNRHDDNSAECSSFNYRTHSILFRRFKWATHSIFSTH